MAVWLSIEIIDKGYDAATNTSTATVNVIANYTSASYNRGNSDGTLPDGTLYINGTSYDFESTFNSMEQDGYETIYSTTVVIDRSVTNEVSCSATFDTGISAGTISASNSATLSGTPSSGSDGDDGGDDGGGDEEEEVDNIYVFNCTLGQGVTVRAAHNSSYDPADKYKLYESGTISVTTNAYIWCIVAENLFPNDCDLTLKVTRNGNELTISKSGDTKKWATVDPGTFEVIAYVTPKSLVRIDNGESLDLYAAYIDNGESLDLYAPYIDNGTGWDLCN